MYLPSGESSPSNGNAVDLDVTTRALSDVGAPINFRVTNATLTNRVYVLDNHDDDPVLDWEYTPITITITETDDGYTLSEPYSYEGYDETGYKFTRKWIDSDATCGANCPWLVVALARGTGHTSFTDDLIAPGAYTFRIRALDENDNPGAAGRDHGKAARHACFRAYGPHKRQRNRREIRIGSHLGRQLGSCRHALLPDTARLHRTVEIRQPGLQHSGRRQPEPHQRVERTSNAGGRRK